MGTTRIPASESWEVKLAPPIALIKEINEQTQSGKALPTPDNDGSYILLPNNTGSLQRYNAAGAQVWTVARTDIHAAIDYWTGVFWLDTTDSAIWVWCYNLGTTPDTYYLAKIALTDGAVTNVGTCQPGDGKFGNALNYYYFERAAMGSGNLVIRDGDQKITLDTSDGSIAVAAAQVTQNGRALDSTFNYETADSAIYTKVFPYWTLSTNVMIGYLQRGGLFKLIMLPLNSPCGSVSTTYPILWGGYIAIVTLSGGLVYNARFFNRTDFDAWLVKIADYYGLPT